MTLFRKFRHLILLGSAGLFFYSLVFFAICLIVVGLGFRVFTVGGIFFYFLTIRLSLVLRNKFLNSALVLEQ